MLGALSCPLLRVADCAAFESEEREEEFAFRGTYKEIYKETYKQTYKKTYKETYKQKESLACRGSGATPLVCVRKRAC